MNWRRVIFGVVIPMLVSAFFGINLGFFTQSTNSLIFVNALILMPFVIWNTVCDGIDGFINVLFGGLCACLTTFLFVNVLKGAADAFSWVYVLKLLVMTIVAAVTVSFARYVAQWDTPEEQPEEDD